MAEGGLGSPRAPSRQHVVGAVAWRELRLASGRKLVRTLFVMSLLPLIVYAAVLVLSVASEEALRVDLGWDPLREFMEIQLFPVFLLALGLGTPMVARDRSENVMFLYATRPVRPLDYTLGKVLAVWLPASALLFVPATVIAALRVGILPDVGVFDALGLVLRMLLLSVLVAWGYAGLTVGASALVRRGRWALALALGVDMVADGIAASAEWAAIGPSRSARALLDLLVTGEGVHDGIFGLWVLVLWGVVGLLVPLWRVRQEMTP